MKVLILGGNRFFGKKLANLFHQSGANLTLLNRGNLDDGFGNNVYRIKCDRNDFLEMKNCLKETKWDLVIDQICFSAKQARESVKLFSENTKRYLFTSSMSVYYQNEESLGREFSESDFDPKKYTFEESTPPEMDYSEAKRQAESVFAQELNCDWTIARLPWVIGADDYTRRFHFHIDRIQNSKSIYFSNPEAKASFIDSDQAAISLFKLSTSKASGAFNLTSPRPIQLKDFLTQIEKALGKDSILTNLKENEAASPFDLKSDFFMTTKKLTDLKIDIEPIEHRIKKSVEKILEF